ncbi:hypothetical protein F511_18424 [Dorcoceras hygrometricum]|uniref:Uncharacterized protein n=1 Tax=Dorcoceras hygrometricum TaxID=472368 RepID=A0A2Z7CCK1_9LAMI|nr:hypothetical protein F511_18424 [Dorcoceras hygrometricum]
MLQLATGFIATSAIDSFHLERFCHLNYAQQLTSSSRKSSTFSLLFILQLLCTSAESSNTATGILRLDASACDWIHSNSCARAKRCHINLCKQHRFAIAISKYHLLVNSSLQLDFLPYDVASLLRLDVQATCWYRATAGLKPSADCDDVIDDVINAKPSAE